ncbi:hypothetical protein HHK36_027639 [Tetracentron sinense]|uniref:Late embryogenesis abundant protein LEA-2 subgroup domain-containing protein n=1 Tax=Tetracentron sinense TaxID=13715 RepID=A0A835D3Q6_TETSI|nr:hypothetical protein HHK36_027639 [Tetracentron sinense]
MTTGDVEAAKLRRKRNRRCCVYIIAGIVFQTIIILVFALTVMRIKSPKVRLRNVTVQTLNTNTSTFHKKLSAQITVKNTNFGHFKFESSTVSVTYNGATVGQAQIDKGRARARQTKKMDITIDLQSSKLSSTSGTLVLSSHAKLSGKVHLFKVIKKKKSAEMSCTMGFNTATNKDTTVGQAHIVKGRARARQTKKMDITIDVNSSRLLSTSGTLTQGSHTKLKWKGAFVQGDQEEEIPANELHHGN